MNQSRSSTGEPTSRPLVVACLRHTDLRPAVEPLTGRVDRDARGAGPAPAEWAALETALRIGQAWDGDVLAVCVGPPDADRTLREAAAVGARVLRVVPAGALGEDLLDPLDGYLDELAGSGAGTAAAIAAAVRTIGEPDLVVCGDRSADRGCGAVPAFLAAELAAAQALGLVRVGVASGAAGGAGIASDAAGGGGDALIGERRLDRGRRERVRIPRPAVISVEAAGLRLRRAGVAEELAARHLPVPVFVADVRGRAVHRGPARPLRPRTRVVPPPAGATPRERLLALTGALEARTPPTLLRPADAAEAAELLLDLLRRQGYHTVATPGGPAGRPA